MDFGKLNTKNNSTRTAGILLPIFSLPSRYGIGSIGSDAYRFIDFLKSAGQTYWQILPVGPTGYGDSPYQSFSAFAANPYFIDLDMLVEEKLLTATELREYTFTGDATTVDYGMLYKTRLRLLECAAARFDSDTTDFRYFQEKNADWLDDYALFMALKEENGMRAFSTWETAVRTREQAAMQKAAARLSDRIKFRKIIQYIFFTQWKRLKSYAHKNGIKVIGDIPIYVARDSSDLWGHRELFQVDGNLEPAAVAGCPPDAFTSDGQLWGNPLYDWEYHRRTGFEWWLRRMSYAEEVYDVVRIDHFRGFAGYYSIPAENKTARGGTWIKAPGEELIAAIKKELPGAAVIAEDLGYLTDDVRELVQKSGFPGMKVLQFAFDSREQSDYLPHNYGRNCVVYTGTHDNTTTYDWQFSAPACDVELAKKYLNTASEADFARSFVCAALASVADTAVIPFQDYLSYGREARINTPGTIGKNWQWRVKDEVFTKTLAGAIFDLTVLYGRTSCPASGK
jgi:4-alpha-glucanotransferase